jgi:hypothetical protein
MARWLKISLRIIGGLVALILLLWIGVAVYVNTHKQELLASITRQLNENINGQLTVESMDPTLVRGFPAISVSLNNVLLRDTAYHMHHHDLLKAKEVSITVNALSLLKGSPRIREVQVREGNVYLFTDSLGYSNTNLFLKKEVRDSSGKKPQPKLNHFFFDNVHFVYENKTQKKLFDFEVDQLEGKFDYRDTGWRANVSVQTLVRSLDFYNPNGPFLRNKKVDADFVLNYNERSGILDIPMKEIGIDDNDVSIGANIRLKGDPVTFSIEISADKIGYQLGRSILSTHIAEKLAIVDMKDPVAVQVSIKGSGKKKDQPLVYVQWQVKDNVLASQGNTIEHCSFTGYFYNKVDPAVPICDQNSVIAVNNFKGTWEAIDFTADSVRIDNLISPILKGHFKSDFNIVKLNPILNNNSFRMDDGTADLNLYFRGGISNNDSAHPYIIGDVHLKDAAITYLPRKLAFTKSAVTFHFTGSDLFVQNMRLQNGPNVLLMEGSMRNLLNLYYTAPEKVLFDWHIRSPQIDLNHYKSFLQARNSRTAAQAPGKGSKSKSINRFSAQLDQILETSSARLRMEIGRIVFQKFSATNLVAAVSLRQSGIALEQVALRHAGGQISLNGLINQNGPYNPFNVAAKVDNVQVAEFFAAFGNFNQTALTSQNIQGNLFAQANITGTVTDKGTLVPGSMNGTASFDLRNGALIAFKPLENIGKYVFRRRNLSYIKIISLKDKLDIKGEKIKIYPLNLSSDAINADIEGVYSFGKGTDINVDVPLRNPKNDEQIQDDSVKQQKRMKGLVVHLNIVNDEDGNMKINLMNKAKSPAMAEADTTDTKKKKRRALIKF